MSFINNILKNLKNINLDLDNIVDKAINIIIIIIAMWVVIMISTKLINKFIEKQSNMKISLDDKKAHTIGAVLKSVVRYTVYFFGISAILTSIFGPITITLAGIGGAAIGFGAQSLIKDVINGFFIIFEDQFSVGEYINIGDKGGVVESVGLRLTRLKDFNGDLHIIPNGSIVIMTNHSRNDMRVLVDVDVAYEEDIDNVINTLEEVCDRFKEYPDIVEGPKVIGVTSLKDSGVSVRVWAKAKPMTQWDCENILRKDIKKALDNAGIEIPYPKRTIYNMQEK